MTDRYHLRPAHRGYPSGPLFTTQDGPDNRNDRVARPDLTFAALRAANSERAAYWHKPGSIPWTIADWSNATAGEAGEMLSAIVDLIALTAGASSKLGFIANAVKKMRRHETGVQQASGPRSLDAARSAVANEIGDVAVYLDLLAHACGLSFADCIVDTFNRVSDREGIAVRLGSAVASATADIKPNPGVINMIPGNLAAPAMTDTSRTPIADRERAPYFACKGMLGTIFVKTGDFFREQGGLRESWGKHWIGIDALSIDDARNKATTYFGMKLSRFLADKE